MNSTLDVLPNIADERELQALDAKVTRAKGEAEQLVSKLREAQAEERAAAEAYTDALSGSDRDVAKAGERAAAATLARQLARARLEVVVAAIDSLLDARPQVVSDALDRVHPAYHAAALAADLRATEAEGTASALRNLANAAKQKYLELERHRRAPKVVSVRFGQPYRTPDGGYQPGDVAGLAPEEAARVVKGGAGTYAEPWRAALADATAPVARSSSGG